MIQPHRQSQQPKYFKTFLTGFFMGSADVVPGVSGGTIAFIMGIYEQLINTIKTVSSTSLKLLLQGNIKQSIISVPWAFLLPLFAGIFIAIFTLAHLVTTLLQDKPVYIWSFFFGLVIASILIVMRRVNSWKISHYAILLFTSLVAYIISGLVPVETPATLLAFFLSGAIAICAMILPGISGSFLLVMMGKYSQILGAVTERNLLVLAVFMAGAVVGLALFARVISFFFSRYHDLVIASLTGLMLGSLRRIWPYKHTIETIIDRHGVEVPLKQINTLPQAVNTELIIAILLCISGAALILKLTQWSAKE